MASAARALGLGVMLGCMVESGLGIAPGAHISSLCDHVDLDGNLLLRATRGQACCSRTAARPHGPARSGRVPEGPGVEHRPGSDAEALRHPRRGLLGRSGVREDGARHPRATRRTRRWRSRLGRSGGDDGRGAGRRHGRGSPGTRADDGGRRAWPHRAGDFRPAGGRCSGSASKPASTSRAGCTSSSGTTRSCGARARHGGSSAISAGRPRYERADRREPRGRREDRPHRRLGLRDRQEDRGVELDRKHRSRGLPSVFCPTGQTGIAIAGWGIAVDAVIADFLAGAAERIVVEGAERGGKLLVVEGQGSLVHPLYSGRDARSDPRRCAACLVLCHRQGRPRSRVARDTPIPPLPSSSSYTSASRSPAGRSTVAAIALNTARSRRRDGARRGAEVEDETGRPSDDPVRFGVARILDAVLAAVGETIDRG